MGLREYRNGWLKGLCPECGKEKLGINILQNRVNCFICGSLRNPLWFLMQIEKLETYYKAYDFLRSFETAFYLKTIPPKKEPPTLQLPKGFKLLSLGNSIISKLARQYMEGRGFNPLKLSMSGIGYCEEGKYQGCIVFPFYKAGKLVYFIGRKFIRLGGEKFINPKLEEVGIGKSFLIYNIDSLQIYKTIRIVESITNAFTLGNTAIAILGKAISVYQFTELLKWPVEEFIIYLDPDAKKQALELGLKLVPFKKIKIVDLPEGEDVNSIGRKAAKEFELKSNWLTYNEIYSEYLDYKRPVLTY